MSSTSALTAHTVVEHSIPLVVAVGLVELAFIHLLCTAVNSKVNKARTYSYSSVAALVSQETAPVAIKAVVSISEDQVLYLGATVVGKCQTTHIEAKMSGWTAQNHITPLYNFETATARHRPQWTPTAPSSLRTSTSSPSKLFGASWSARDPPSDKGLGSSFRIAETATQSRLEYVKLENAHAPVRLAPVERPTEETPAASIHQSVLAGSRTPATDSARRHPEFPSAVEAERQAALLESRRQRGRMHQERYRIRQRRGLQELEGSIQTLRQDIQQLRMEKQTTLVFLSTITTVWSVAAEYFRLFRFGLQEISSMSDRGSEVQIQRSFVHAAIDPDMLYSSMRGVDALLENWQYMSLCYKGIYMQPTCMEQGADGAVIATVASRFTITESTLRMAFPHLLKRDDNGNVLSIATKLLGQRIVMKGTAEFKWDHDRGCLTSIKLDPDFITPLLGILGNLEDVTYVFSGALITTESKAIC
ncbi:hypothetical protein ON010_g11416 [Phytophthora cinnamomi]|nr:hypothetical protein ON010_g11416 [Phytophthora cinnamomi]